MKARRFMDGVGHIPINPELLRQFAKRMFDVAAISGATDETITQAEYELLRRHLPRAGAPPDLDKPSTDRFLFLMKEEFLMQNRGKFVTGLASELLPHIQHTVEFECQNASESLQRLYKYIVYQTAKEQLTDDVDAHGQPIIFDKGNAGLRLRDFTKRIHVLGGKDIVDVETAVLRMYTTEFYKPWNNALRGLDENFKPDASAMKKWATCIAVLCGALVKLSRVKPKHGFVPVRRAGPAHGHAHAHAHAPSTASSQCAAPALAHSPWQSPRRPLRSPWQSPRRPSRTLRGNLRAGPRAGPRAHRR